MIFSVMEISHSLFYVVCIQLQRGVTHSRLLAYAMKRVYQNKELIKISMPIKTRITPPKIVALPAILLPKVLPM